MSHRTRLFEGYRPPADTYDEAFTAGGRARNRIARVIRLLNRLGPEEFQERMRLADTTFLRYGVTFAVYGEDGGNVERIFPFDLVPRTIAAPDWARTSRGLEQRVRALNAFLADVYGDRRILEEGVVPREIVERSRGYLAEMRGVRPPGGVHIHIAGIDLVRGPDGAFVVLEDNVRTPSGVSYVLENRAVMKRVFPGIFAEANVEPVDEYPARLKDTLGSLVRRDESPRVVMLTPGPFNAAYFEHTFLARRMGCELVQGQDLLVADDRVYVKTTRGPQPVDVIYRRIDDAFLDPDVFRADSQLGVPGLMKAYAAGNVTLANAVGTGVADDKAIYPFVPDMIRFYLDEDPMLPQVRTWVCARDTERQHVMAHLDKLVVKAVDEAGGYGMLVGPQASKRARQAFGRRIAAEPRKYIAQPLVELSTCPTWTRKGMEPRRVDLRPFVLMGRKVWVLPGGLTRVALRPGSYVVNSSQGGGAKDTWVLRLSKRGR